jgi:hypothetical protein
LFVSGVLVIIVDNVNTDYRFNWQLPAPAKITQGLLKLKSFLT